MARQQDDGFSVQDPDPDRGHTRRGGDLGEGSCEVVRGDDITLIAAILAWNDQPNWPEAITATGISRRFWFRIGWRSSGHGLRGRGLGSRARPCNAHSPGSSGTGGWSRRMLSGFKDLIPLRFDWLGRRCG